MSLPALRIRAPLLWLVLPLMAGIAAARQWPAPGGPWPWIALALAGALAAIGLARRTAAFPWAMAVSFAAGCGGFALLHVRHPHLHDPPTRAPREATVDIEVRQLFATAATARTVSGVAILQAGEYDPLLAGQRAYFSLIRRLGPVPERGGCYRLQGVLEPLVADGTSFTSYLLESGVRHRLARARVVAELAPPGAFARWCAAVDRRLQAILRRGLDDHPAAASLYLAMVIGEKAVLNADQQNAFVRTGTFHIFSISGLHVGVIAYALVQVLRIARLPRRASMLITLPVLWLYVEVTGGSSPAIRSFIMVAFMLSAKVLRVPENQLAALAASALAILLVDPLQLGNGGFQISYAVVAALILMGHPLAQGALARWKPFAWLPPGDWHRGHHACNAGGAKLIRLLAGCWTAFLASAAAGIGYFGYFSPASLLANLVVVPLSCTVINLGFASLTSGLVGLWPVSLALNRIAAVLIDVTDRLVQAGAALPGASFVAEFRAPWLAAGSLVLMTTAMAVGASLRWSRRVGGFWLPVAVLALLLVLGTRFG
jgi:competence protein ComEC